jgi:hypothetical protein
LYKYDDVCDGKNIDKKEHVYENKYDIKDEGIYKDENEENCDQNKLYEAQEKYSIEVNNDWKSGTYLCVRAERTDRSGVAGDEEEGIVYIYTYIDVYVYA